MSLSFLRRQIIKRSVFQSIGKFRINYIQFGRTCHTNLTEIPKILKAYEWNNNEMYRGLYNTNLCIKGVNETLSCGKKQKLLCFQFDKCNTVSSILRQADMKINTNWRQSEFHNYPYGLSKSTTVENFVENKIPIFGRFKILPLETRFMHHRRFHRKSNYIHKIYMTVKGNIIINQHFNCVNKKNNNNNDKQKSIWVLFNKYFRIITIIFSTLEGFKKFIKMCKE